MHEHGAPFQSFLDIADDAIKELGNIEVLQVKDVVHVVNDVVGSVHDPKAGSCGDHGPDVVILQASFVHGSLHVTQPKGAQLL